ncbi:MAG: YhdH/YhfP family quinone oxidoreductase [Desulfuromonadaceae bacterium]
MENDTNFKALVVEKSVDKQFTRGIRERTINDLQPGDLVVRVHYSSLNYKDALSATGHPGVTRQFPHTPGIDAAGEVVSCQSGVFSPGEKVLITGYDLGMETDGGWGQLIRIPSEWALRLPEGLSLRDSMALGTAGFTAGLSVLKLVQAGVHPDQGSVLVTGATGGVGSIAVAILAGAGYRVVASTGKEADTEYLKGLGAAEVISRDAVAAGAEKAVLLERWGGVVDVVGGTTLVAALKSTKYGGTVTCCGLVGSPELSLNVYPFILRGVSLIGIDSVQCPLAVRAEVWKRLASAWKPARLDDVVTECTLQGIEPVIQAILKGNVTGRTVINMMES